MNTPTRSVLTPTKRGVNTPVFSPNSIKRIEAAQTTVSTKNITKSRLRPRKFLKKMVRKVKKSNKENDPETVRIQKILEEVEDRKDEDYVEPVVTEKNGAVTEDSFEENEETDATQASQWTREENQSAPTKEVKLDANDNIAADTPVKAAFCPTSPSATLSPKPADVNDVALLLSPSVPSSSIDVIPVKLAASTNLVVTDNAAPATTLTAEKAPSVYDSTTSILSMPEKETACFAGLKSTMRCTIS